MVDRFYESKCGFSPVQHDVKLLGPLGAPSQVPGKKKVRFDNTILTCNNNNNINNKNSNTVTNILSKKSIIGDGEYSVEDFNYLIGKEHVDPENGLVYITVSDSKAWPIHSRGQETCFVPQGPVRGDTRVGCCIIHGASYFTCRASHSSRKPFRGSEGRKHP